MVSSNNLFELEQIVVKNTGVDTTHIFKEIHKEGTTWQDKDMALIQRTASLTS